MGQKLSQITNGGALVAATDQLVAVRTGNTDVRVTPGTAAALASSSNSATTLAALTGSITLGHLAVFADTNGTLQDGGVAGTAAAKAASDGTKATVASVSGGTTIGHIATFADIAGTIQDGGPFTVTESDIALSDVTTDDVSSSAHGFAPKSPADATQFLNGNTTPTYSHITDAVLSISDITTNNVSTSAHGFTPKLPNDATKYLDGTGAYSVPPGSGGPAYIASSGTATAAGTGSLAAGPTATSAAVGSVVMGRNASTVSSATSSVVIGDGANQTGGFGSDSVLIGGGANAAGMTEIVLVGASTTATGDYGIAVGGQASAGQYGVAIGLNTSTSASTAVAIGRNITVSTANAVMIGNSTNAFGLDGSGGFNLYGNSGVLVHTANALTDGAAANTATLTNAPAIGNPTKWIPINDAGTTRYIPAW